MGNESSRGGGGGGGGNGGGGRSVFSRAKGIVVVREGQTTKQDDPNDDPDLKRLREMPRFLPILRSSVNRRDVSEHRAISPRPILQLTLRLSNHFSLCAKAVSQKQSNLTAMINSVDAKTIEVTKTMNVRKKSLDALGMALGRVKKMNDDIERIHLLLESLIPSLDSLNSILIPSDRLPPLSLSSLLDPLPPIDSSPPTSSASSRGPSSSSSTPSHIPSSSRDSPRKLAPIEEVKVVDKKILPKK